MNLDKFNYIPLSIGNLNWMLPMPRYNSSGLKEVVFTKFDAYRDLLYRASMQKPGTYTKVGEVFTLVPGQIDVKITDLAKDWGWGRTKTSEFIHDLDFYGYISASFLSKFYILTMNQLVASYQSEVETPADTDDDNLIGLFIKLNKETGE